MVCPKRFRNDRDTRASRWFEVLWKHHNREEIGVLTLVKGYEWDPGPQWIAIVGLFGFQYYI